MLDVLTAIKERREITQFTAEPIHHEQIEQLIQALYYAPTGNNLPSREFILVSDQTMLQALTPATPFMKWLEHSACAFVIVGNPEESKYWLQDATLAGGYLWLAAQALGIGAAWGAIYHSEDHVESEKRESFVRERLQIPDALRVVAIIGLGYAAVQPPTKAMIPLDRVFHRETYGREVRGDLTDISDA